MEEVAIGHGIVVEGRSKKGMALLE